MVCWLNYMSLQMSRFLQVFIQHYTKSLKLYVLMAMRKWQAISTCYNLQNAKLECSRLPLHPRLSSFRTLADPRRDVYGECFSDRATLSQDCGYVTAVRRINTVCRLPGDRWPAVDSLSDIWIYSREITAHCDYLMLWCYRAIQLTYLLICSLFLGLVVNSSLFASGCGYAYFGIFLT